MKRVKISGCFCGFWWDSFLIGRGRQSVDPDDCGHVQCIVYQSNHVLLPAVGQFYLVGGGKLWTISVATVTLAIKELQHCQSANTNMKWLCNCVGGKGMRWISPPAIGLTADTATTSIYPRHHSNAMMSYINKGRTPAKKCFLSGIARITSDLNWDLTYRGNLSLVRMWGKPLFKNPDSNEHCPFWRRLLVMICGTFLSLKRWFDKISQIS